MTCVFHIFHKIHDFARFATLSVHIPCMTRAEFPRDCRSGRPRFDARIRGRPPEAARRWSETAARQPLSGTGAAAHPVARPQRRKRPDDGEVIRPASQLALARAASMVWTRWSVRGSPGSHSQCPRASVRASSRSSAAPHQRQEPGVVIDGLAAFVELRGAILVVIVMLA